MNQFARAIQRSCDSYLRPIYYPLILATLLLSTAFTGWQGYRLAVDWEECMIGEWLVNYAAGFVRRGLSGEALLVASTYLGTPANQLAWLAVLGTTGLFCVALASLLYQKRLTFWFVVLCLTPTCLLFTFYNDAAVGRKDSVTMAAFAVWALLSQRVCARYVFWPAIAIGSVLLTLTHEMFLFFSPYFVFLAFLASRQEGARGGWKASLLIPAFSTLAAALILAYSGAVNDPALCERLMSMGAPAKVCKGILAYEDPGLKPALDEFVGHFDAATFTGLALVLPLVLIPAYLCLSSIGPRGLTPGQIARAIGLFIILSAPLFVLARDWGRWIAIHSTLTATVCAFLLPASNEPSPHETPEGGGSLAYVALGVAVLACMFLWSVDYCCEASYLKPFGPRTAVERAWGSLDF